MFQLKNIIANKLYLLDSTFNSQINEIICDNIACMKCKCGQTDDIELFAPDETPDKLFCDNCASCRVCDKIR